MPPSLRIWACACLKPWAPAPAIGWHCKPSAIYGQPAQSPIKPPCNTLTNFSMNVIIKIQGREATPVRAIPLITNWMALYPDLLSKILNSNEDAIESNQEFKGLTAFLIDKENPKAIKSLSAAWWSFPARKIAALSEEIESRQITHNVGYDEWRKQSIAGLPAGTFVWRDEFERCYYRKYGADSWHLRTKCQSEFLPSNPDEEMSECNSLRFRERLQSEIEKYKLDYDPIIYYPEHECIIEGFENYLSKKPQAITNSQKKKWTDELKVEVREYRDRHGLKKTAEYYGCSEATISKHVPADKPKNSPFSGLGQRKR